MNLREEFLKDVDRFLAANPDLSESTIAVCATGNRYVIERIRSGGNVELDTLQRVLDLIAAAESGAFTFPGRKPAA